MFNPCVRSCAKAAVLASPAFVASPASAIVQPVAQFVGEKTDTFDQFSNVNALLSLPVFGGFGSLNTVSPDGAIKLEFSSSLNGDLVRPISGMMAGQLDLADWAFNEPVSRFGGFWENNSGASNANIRFYDGAGNQLASLSATIPVAGQRWVWNGWESDVPFTRVRVTGNGLFNGFIWYENMQVTRAVPAPGAFAAVAIVWMAAFPGRRRA